MWAMSSSMIRILLGVSTLFTDPVKVRQVLINLTGNAAKFTEAGHILIHQTWDEPGREAVIEVSDTGIGIGEEDLERLFEAFTQLEDARSKRHDGTGLGLTITRERCTASWQ